MFNIKTFDPFYKNEVVCRINASIVNHNGSLYSSYRSQHLFDYDSRTWLIELDNLFNVISYKPLKASNNNTAFEDVRLFSFDDLLFAFYTYLPYDSGKWVWKFGVGFGIVDTERGLITHQVSLRKLSLEEMSKNWVPYRFNNELFLITNFSPYLRILKLFDNNGRLVLKEHYLNTKKNCMWEYGQIRGGTPLIAEEGSNSLWVYGFVHSHVSNFEGFERFYYYTVVRMNPLTYELEYFPSPLGSSSNKIDKKYVRLWNESTRGKLKVIFPIGIINYKCGVLVSFGIDDIHSRTEYFDWNFIKNLFENK